MAETSDNCSLDNIKRSIECVIVNKCDVLESKLEHIALTQMTLHGCLEKVESAAGLETKLDQLKSMQTALRGSVETVGSTVSELKSEFNDLMQEVRRNSRATIESDKIVRSREYAKKFRSTVPARQYPGHTREMEFERSSNSFVDICETSNKPDGDVRSPVMRTTCRNVSLSESNTEIGSVSPQRSSSTSTLQVGGTPVSVIIAPLIK